MHSDCACVYIFSDSNRDNLSLDISIDLVQIIGRCRTFSNPYRDEIRYYYKCKDAEDIDLNEATDTINHKTDVSYKLFNTIRMCQIRMCLILSRTHRQEKGLMEKLSDCIRRCRWRAEGRHKPFGQTCRIESHRHQETI